ncbi:hypothetical protein EV356DRAFT_520984 [Viridothelium virens]|uniref:Uncharacterized protein n=1 Tax=Viridothelium virens TaxID=1048519 RepID=A0A6A6GV02_VIRVR|nr:hypothetical protein EV356DRAFT_520984 [Viridothelium virens]
MGSSFYFTPSLAAYHLVLTLHPQWPWPCTIQESAFELAVREKANEGREAIFQKRRADIRDDDENSHRNKHQRLVSLDRQQESSLGISGFNNEEERDLSDHHGAVRGASSVDELEYFGSPRVRPEERKLTQGSRSC